MSLDCRLDGVSLSDIGGDGFGKDSIRGTVSGRVTVLARPTDPATIGIDVALKNMENRSRVQNAMIRNIRNGLLKGTLSVAGNRIRIGNMEFRSGQLHASLSGRIESRMPLSDSRLDVTARLKPDGAGALPGAATALPVIVRIAGSAADPIIRFEAPGS